MKLRSITVIFVLLLASSGFAKKPKRSAWRQEACSIVNVLVVTSGDYSTEAALREVGNLTWMHPILPKAGQGIYAQPPDGVRIDGRIVFDSWSEGWSSFAGQYGGSAGEKTAYKITLFSREGTWLWRSQAISLNGIRSASGSSWEVQQGPLYEGLIEQLGKQAKCASTARGMAIGQ